MKRWRRKLLVSLTAPVLLLLVACEKKSIRQIQAEPGRYADREVAIVGQVTQSYSVLGHGAYQVDDGTGKMWIVSDKGVPREGAKVWVRGTIRDGYNLGSLVKLPQDLRSVLVMIESAHRAER